MKDERRALFDRVLQVKHKNLQKNKNQRKVVTAVQRLLEERIFQNT